MRHLRHWLLGLFIVAQLAGLVPLLDAHTQHAGQAQMVSDIVHDDSGQRDDANCCDQCCTLHHHLAGIVGVPLMTESAVVVSERITPRVVARLAGRNPFLLDRPPKALSLS